MPGVNPNILKAFRDSGSRWGEENKLLMRGGKRTWYELHGLTIRSGKLAA
jgi:hypothetical protein